MGFLDQLFGKPSESNKDAENAARAEALRQSRLASEGFIAGGAPVYQPGQQYYFNELGQLEQLGPSEMQNIQTDPRLMQAQYDALRELETRGREGFTARDELGRLKTKQDVAKENAGRLGAIQQNMAARGMGGSGLDLVAQMQAAQAATEREALAGLERNAAAEQNRTAAATQGGQLAGNIRGQGFQEQSAKAQAQDLINRFNTQNSVNRSIYNNQGINRTNAENVSRANETMDRNTQGQYGFRKDVLGVNQGQQQMNYNAATEDLNAKRLRDEEARRRKAGQIAAIGTLAGAGIGAFGGPGGATAGAQIGGAAGTFAGGFSHGGKVPDYWKGGKLPCYADGGYIDSPEVVPWDSPLNDNKQINVSGGEIVIPKSIANDPLASARFVDQENRKQMEAARSKQDMYGLGNILGSAATDFANSQRPNVVLANTMENLGRAPSIVRPEKSQWDSSVLENLGRKEIGRASENAAMNERSANRNASLMDEASLKDPNSPESVAAREFILNIAPGIREKVPNFDKLTAKGVSKIAPYYQNMNEMAQKSAMQKEAIAARRAGDILRAQESQLRYKSETEQKAANKAEKEAIGTTVQQSSRGFGKRMEDANAIFDKIEKSGYDRSSLASGLGSIAPNFARSAEAQMQDQAERNFVNALLRKESGAAIGKDEFASAEVQYFPRAGDTPEVIAQKKANRERAIDTLKRESGKTWDTGESKPENTGATGSWRDEL